MEISPVEEELFHEDRRTDMTKLIVSCRNFSNGLKKIVGNVVKSLTIFRQTSRSNTENESSAAKTYLNPTRFKNRTNNKLNRY